MSSFLKAHHTTSLGTKSKSFSKCTNAKCKFLFFAKYFSCSCLKIKICFQIFSFLLYIWLGKWLSKLLSLLLVTSPHLCFPVSNPSVVYVLTNTITSMTIPPLCFFMSNWAFCLSTILVWSHWQTSSENVLITLNKRILFTKLLLTYWMYDMKSLFTLSSCGFHIFLL